MICSDSGCRIRLCADGTVYQSLSGHLSCGAVGWNIRARPRLDSTRLLPVRPSPLPLCSSSPPLLLFCFAPLSRLRLHRTSEQYKSASNQEQEKSRAREEEEDEHEMQTQTTTPSYAGSAYRPQQQQQQRYYPTRASAQQYANYNTNPAYQTLSPSTFYPTSPTSATVYSRATTPGAGAGRSTYSGYVNTFGTQKPAHTRLPMKRVRFQRARPSLSFASPDPNTPAMPTMPPGRVHTASTARSRSRRPVYAYAPQQQYQQQYQQTQRPQAQQQYPFHMPAYGPPQPFAVPSSAAANTNTNTNASTRRRPHHAHAHTTAPSATAPAPAVPASTPRIPTTRTSRLARRPSKANMGYTRLGPSHGRRTGSGASSGASSGARSLSLCALVGRLADALLGNGPHTAARRAASAAAKLSGASGSGSGSRMGSGAGAGSGHRRNARRDAVWRAQLEDVVCRECARLLEYAQ